MKCPNCNFEVMQPTKFCPECGAKLPEELNETVAPATPQSTAEQEVTPAKKPKKSKKKLILIISISVACLAVLAGAFFILRAINPGCMFGHENTREEKIKEATCTDSPRYRYVCEKCGETDYERSWGSYLEHDYGTIQCGVPSTCKNCGEQKTFEHETEYSETKCKHCGMDEYTLILPQTPQTVYCYDYRGNIEEAVEITNMEIGYSLNQIGSVSFAVKRTYHENGENYSAKGRFGWKLYNSDGAVIDSGTAYTNATIKVGETSYGYFNLYGLGKWTSYRVEILNLS